MNRPQAARFFGYTRMFGVPSTKISRVSFFFFSSRRRHTRSLRDWSSDVCSSDLHKAVEHMRRSRLHALEEPPSGIDCYVVFADQHFDETLEREFEFSDGLDLSGYGSVGEA